MGGAKDHKSDEADDECDEQAAAAPGHDRGLSTAAATAAASAALGGELRVRDAEAAAGVLRLVDILDGRAVHIGLALRVDRDGDARALDDLIGPLRGRVEGV